MDAAANLRGALAELGDLVNEVKDSEEDSSHKDTAKRSVSLAYALVSLFYISRACEVEELENHALHNELGRIKSYLTKLPR